LQEIVSSIFAAAFGDGEAKEPWINGRILEYVWDGKRSDIFRRVWRII
jgi:hypothetical protein